LQSFNQQQETRFAVLQTEKATKQALTFMFSGSKKTRNRHLLDRHLSLVR
jgi:hypothetical protein